MQCCTCPEFYPRFTDKIAYLLLIIFTYSFDTGCFLRSLPQTSISLILKKNKDSLSGCSYHPMSLLNVNNKILTKILALRLENVLPFVVSPDQTGFIKKRYAFSNISCLFNVMYNPSNSKDPFCDQFGWRESGAIVPNLDLVRFGFISWINLLYTYAFASVRTNNNHHQIIFLFMGAMIGLPDVPLAPQ